MKEIPILFSGEMVRAILDGQKTQTRRIAKQLVIGGGEGKSLESPYQIGDRLWVRETFCELDSDHLWNPLKPRDMLYSIGDKPRRNGCAYKAETDSEGDAIRQEYGYKWTPSIHMPRWASRLTLEVTGVRVERLQDISERDAINEGVKYGSYKGGECRTCAKGAFMDAWNSLYAKRGFGWDANPWVWVIEFKKTNQDAGG